MEFLGSNIISINQFEKDDIELIFKTADSLIPFANRSKLTKVLDGAILSNMFFEPSTRTKNLYDTSRVLSGYSDIIVMRHPIAGSVQEFADASRVPVINGGDGDNEHPSQALLDLYTIKKELESRGKTIENARVALIGDLKYGRAVHSLCKILSLYKNISLNLVSPEKLKLPSSLIKELNVSSVSLKETDNIQEGISDVDILYVTRIQEERFNDVDEAKKYKGLMSLNEEIYTKNCEPNTVIMHPLPRDSRNDANELDSDLNQNPNLAIYRQTDNGLLIRMSLFTLILGVSDQINDSASDINWYSNKS